MITSILFLLFATARPAPQPLPACKPQSDKICVSQSMLAPRAREVPLRGRR